MDKFKILMVAAWRVRMATQRIKSTDSDDTRKWFHVQERLPSNRLAPPTIDFVGGD